MKIGQVEESRFSISEASVFLDRSPNTLRSWDRNQIMPPELRPLRDAQGHRYWTPSLIERIKEWMRENNFYPGRAIAYNPSPERLQRHIDRIRVATHSSIRRIDPRYIEIRNYIHHAVYNLHMDPKDVIAKIPDVVNAMNTYGADLKLTEVLEIASDVIGD